MRIKWNRQLDGSLTRREAEEAAAAVAATSQVGKDKPKSTTPKIFRIFRRKKHSRRSDEQSDRQPEPTPSEADDEDCASISSVASQPVTELCHRDRTVSLFSSFRLNFPGGKKKSKRGGGTPLFPPENDSQNNRYSSPDLMRDKPARPLADLSKSSPSVRNTNDSAASIPGVFPSFGELRTENSVSFQQLKHNGPSSIPGDFPSLGELRTENSASFQQLKHNGPSSIPGDFPSLAELRTENSVSFQQLKHNGLDVTKLAKSVSFSDCQATVNSKQVTCVSARTLRTPNGRTEPKTTKCLSRSTEIREKNSSESGSSGNDSLHLPVEPSCWKSAAEVQIESAMSAIISSSSNCSDQICEDKCLPNDVRERWFSEVRRTDLNRDLFGKSANGSISDKHIVILNGNSVVSRDMCSTKISHASDASCDFVCGSSSTNISDGLRTSEHLRDILDEVSDVYNADPVLKSRIVKYESAKTTFIKPSSSQLLKNINEESSRMHACVTDSSEGEIKISDIAPSSVEVASALQNCDDFAYACTHFANAEGKLLCNGGLTKHTFNVKSNCVQSDILNSVPNTNLPEVNDLNTLPDKEKQLLNEMLLNFGLNAVENEVYSFSVGPCPNPETIDIINKNTSKPEIVSEKAFPLDTLLLGDKGLSLNDCPSYQHLLNLPLDNSSIAAELEDVHSLPNPTVDNLINSERQNYATSEGSDLTPVLPNHNIFDLNYPKSENLKRVPESFKEPSDPLLNEPIIDVETNNIIQFSIPCDGVVKDEIIIADKRLEPDFLCDSLISNKNNSIFNSSFEDFENSNASLSSILNNEKSLTDYQHFSPLLSTYLKSNNNFVNNSLLHFNFLNLLSDNIDFDNLSKKSSVLNPILYLDDPNNNSLFDTESYLHKLTDASNDSEEHGKKSVTVWNASFVQSLIETLPCQQQSLGLSDHVPAPYATACGKLELEERCPDITCPSGYSSDSVTLRESDLHTDSNIHQTQNTGDGSEMLAKVGASVAFCESPSVFLKDDEIKESCSEIYDGTDVCDGNLISFSSESRNTFTTESCDIVLSDDCCVTESSSNLLKLPVRSNVDVDAVLNGCCSDENVSDLTSFESNMMHYGLCDDISPVSDLISNGYCSGSSLQFESDVYSTSNSHECTTEPDIDPLPVNSIEISSDLSLEVIETVNGEGIIDGFSSPNSVITNGYHAENNLSTELLYGIGVICIPPECENHTLDLVNDELELNNVKEKIQFFENGSTGLPVESCDNKRSCEVKTTTTRRKSLERSKNSMIPSLRKSCLKAVSVKHSQTPDGKKFKNETVVQPSIDYDSELQTVDEFENIHFKNVLPDGNDHFKRSSSLNDYNRSLELDSRDLSIPDSENHFVVEVGNSTSSEFSKRCRSAELLSYLPESQKVQKFKSRLQTRRHSSTETNVAHNGGKDPEKGLTTELTSSFDLNYEDAASVSSLQRSSNLTLDTVQGVQGQKECGLQTRCASLPLVIGQVRATSRRNCPIKDASSGKSRIPRKQGGLRGSLHTKPARPPAWLSKAELTAEIQRLGTLCEARTKELNRLKMETKHVSVGFDAFASLFKYMVEDLNALSMPALAEDLKKTLKQLELAKQDLAYYEREVEEMKAHHCQELNDLSNKLFEVFHGEVTELSAKHQEEMNRLKSDHQQQIENLSSTFDVTSQETVSQHEAAIAKLQQEIISQREELQQLHDREIADLEEKHSQSSKTLQEHIEQLQKKCAELKQHSMGMEDAMRKDTDTKLQWVTSRKVDLEKEVESLKAVLEMKNKELHTLRVQNLEMEKQLEELPLAREKIKMLQARAEDLEALMLEKTKLERQLATENQQMRETYEKENKVNKRLSMENEELLWRIRQAEQSFVSADSFSVAEYPEDIENGSMSPTKSPPPPHMSRSVFFTYMDKEDQTSSPRSQYKKIAPGFAASYKTSPYKSPPAPSPRRAKSNSEPPQPPSYSSSTPRKSGTKQTNLKQKKRQRSGSDCGKVNSDQPDVTFLSVAGSMTSSVSSESSVFGERLLEEHKEQILESLEILREQRSSLDQCPVESEDMSRSSEFSDPKTYYHMTFPVSGMPDCDINVTAQQAIHSTPDSTSPVVATQQIVPAQKVDLPENSANSVNMAHSFENVHEAVCEKSKDDRWRTI